MHIRSGVLRMFDVKPIAGANLLNAGSQPENPNERRIGVGVIGCGGFGLFALQQFAQVPGVNIIGLSDTQPASANAAISRFGLPDSLDVESLVAIPGIDLVYIATPPFL